MNNFKVWIGAFRLRTLPLAFSTIILGSLLSASQGIFNFSSFYLAMITTLLLQILSNLANDLGDSLKGTDTDERIGPQRAVQSGEISLSAMKKAVIVFSLLSLISGLLLLYVSFESFNWYFIGFFILGLFSIAAAIKYTLGSKPYGYAGLGDVFVFLFFGLVGVFGSYFIHSLSFDWTILLPAASIGAFSVAVLNMNNMRDIENDRKSEKLTVVVKMGFDRAKYYHLFLISLGIVSAISYTWLNWSSPMLILGFVSFPIFIKNLSFVLKNNDPSKLNPELKKIALSTLVFSLSFGFVHLFF